MMEGCAPPHSKRMSQQKALKTKDGLKVNSRYPGFTP